MPQFLLHMKNGQIANLELTRKIFALLKDGMHMVKITSMDKRSLDQNRYFHGVMLPIVAEGLRDAGWDEIRDEEDAKSFVKKLFATRSQVNHNTGEVVEFIQDTHKMTKPEFSVFIDDIVRWGAEYLGIQIPYPNEY